MFSLLNIVVRVHRCNEITGDDLCALMNQLIEGVLAIGAGLAPDDGASGIVDLVAGAGDVPSLKWQYLL
jgi:hypothetical protein